MNAKLTGAGPEDQPAGLGVGVLQVRPAEDVAEERSGGRRILGVEQCVQSGDHLVRLDPLKIGRLPPGKVGDCARFSL
jgi:hypothetical protein